MPALLPRSEAWTAPSVSTSTAVFEQPWAAQLAESSPHGFICESSTQRKYAEKYKSKSVEW